MLILVLIVCLLPANARAQTNHAPNAPVLSSPSDGATNVGSPAILDIFASDPDGDRLTVTFYGHQGATEPDFLIAVFGDTQNYYSVYGSTGNDYFKAQSDWLVANRVSKNVAYVAQVGDVTDNNVEPEWIYASDAMAPLENPSATGLPYGIPFTVAIGNHDELGGTTALFNQYFGISRFLGRDYYGGHYGSGSDTNSNDNHYDLFSAGGMDFIVIELKYGVHGTTAVLTWANQLLQQYSTRRAIVVSHGLLTSTGTWGSDGQAVYDTLKANSNLFLMLCGHAGADVKRTDVYNGNTVYTMMIDYSSEKNGGNAYIRLLRFSPANNNIHVTTYSPIAGDRTASPIWDLPYTMGRSFIEIGTSTVAAGSNATVTWDNLTPDTQYEWYTTVSDGQATTTGPKWTFSTVTQLPPAAPSALTATAVPTRQVNLSWTDNAPNESGFSIERSLDGRTFTSLATVNANVIRYSDTGLTTATTYYYRVRAFNAIGDSQFSNVANATIAAAVPAAPSSLTAAVAASQITVSWTDKSSNEDGFAIERSLDGMSFSTLASTAADVTNYADTTALPSTMYYYRVLAFNSAGVSTYSNTASALIAQLAFGPVADTTIRADYPANNYGTDTDLKVDGSPYKQALLKFTVSGVNGRTVNNASLRLWVTDGASFGGYFYRVADNSWTETGVTWNNAPAHDPNPITTLGAVAVGSRYSADLTGLIAGDGTYSVMITSDTTDRIVYSSRESTNAPQLVLTMGGSAPPAAPSSLTAAAVNGSEIDLGWADNSNNEDGFTVERSLNNSDFVQIATVAADISNFKDTGLGPATLYYYRVTAFNAAGTSAYSNVANATTGQTAPAAPSGLTAAAAGSTTINLAWTDNANNEDGFKIERSSDGLTFAQQATVAANIVSYADSTVAAGSTYYYRVRAYNTAGDSGFSNTASATTAQVPPAAPTSLTATAAGSTQVNLAWNESSTAVDGFNLERSADGVNFTALATVSGATTTYIDTGLTPSTTYSYRVRAFNSAGTSGYSNVASATTAQVAPAAPSGLTATPVGANQINLAWGDNSTNEQGFKIERSNDGKTFAPQATVAANVTAYSDTGLSAATTYYYRVRAYNLAGDSGYSNVASASTGQVPPAAPTNLTAHSVSSGQINLAWTDNASNEDSFRIERSPDNTTFAEITTVAVNVTSYNDTGLAAATTYYYRVRAHNAAGDSDYSNVASATTAQVSGTISGKVSSGSGNGISGATVSYGGGSTTTDSSGNYVLSNVAPGTYSVTASASGYQSNSQTVAVASGNTTTQNFTLTAIPGTINGKVSNSAGSGIVGATVSYSGGSTTTDGNGNYTLSNVVPGTYNVTASSNGYQSLTKSVGVNPGSTATADFVLTATPGMITGRVSNSVGSGITGATVSYSGASSGSTATNSSGDYTLNLLPGAYTVTASASGYQNASQSVTVNSAATSVANFTLAVQTGTIKGKVQSNGRPVVAATVTFVGGLIATAPPATTAADGTYDSGLIPIGSYTVTVTSAGYKTQSKSGTVSSNTITTVNFTLKR